MEDKRLDNIIDSKLGDFELPYQPGSWDALANKLNDADATERFDEGIRRKLSDIDQSYQPLYWDLLAQRLEQETTFRRQLLRYKATEILLVFLILITFVQIFQNQTMKNMLPFGNKVISEKITPRSSTSIDVYKSNESISSNFISEIPTSSEEVFKYNDVTASPSDFVIPSNDRFSRIRQFAVSPTSPLLSKNAIAPLSMENQTLDQLGYEAINERSKTIETIHSQSIALLENKATALPKPEPIEKRWRIGILASSNIDYIQTPYDEIFGLAPISRFDLGGYSGGISISKEWKRWEVETGLIYSHKKYESKDPYFYYGNISDGYSVEGVKNIEFNTIQIPVNVSYDVIQKEKWHFYALGGAS
ncbi:MAG: hypothetical protein AAFO82_16430, partial [Bacteroidota bacterium]